MKIIAIILLVSLYFDYRLIKYTYYFRRKHERSCRLSAKLYYELIFSCILFSVVLLFFGCHYIIGVLR